MTAPRRLWLSLLVLGTAIVVLTFFGLAPGLVQSSMNPVAAPPPYPVDAAARRLHSELTVADLHADSLLWRRDLNERSGVGHIDIPRLLDGNVAIQAFTAVIKVPAGQNIESNADGNDRITPLVVAQLWPPRTWTSLLQRALHQADKLQHFANESNGRLVVIRTSDDLRRVLDRRAAGDRVVAGFLGIEGAQALEGRAENLAAVFAAGYRMLGLTHFYDNAIGGSAHGTERGGLTPLGREVVGRAEDLGVLIDLAHASPALLDDVLAIATRPVVVSHTGVRGTCDNQRNLSDDQLRRIAANGGVVGIGFWPTAVCGTDAGAIAGAIRHALDVMGPAHVALGSDFDGTVAVPFDASGMARVTEALLEGGVPESTVRAVMGGNVERLLLAGLPVR